jgi:DNA-binding Lrp family transcriptional regulator
MKQTFTQIPDNWNALDLESRFILAYMLRYQDNGKQYFAKIETFCKTSGIHPKTYQRRVKALKDAGVIKIVGYIQNAIPIYKVDKNEADFVGEHGLVKSSMDKTSTMTGQNVHTDKTICPPSKDDMSTSIGQSVQHTIQGTRQVTKENTKEEYQPENSSFESFKNNKKKKTEYLDGTDLALFAKTLD